MSGSIFICYRREDSRHAAGRLVERLERTFDKSLLFFDVDAIEPGLDFVSVINDRIAVSEACLVIIGSQWLQVRDENRIRRLDDPNDYVRLEIEAALKRNIRVIPILVDGAPIPPENALPPGLRPLVRRNAVRLTHERFGVDADDLAQLLQTLLRPPAGKSPTWWPFGGDNEPEAASEPPKITPPPPPPIAREAPPAYYVGVVSRPQPLAPPSSEPAAPATSNSTGPPQIGFLDAIKICFSKYADFSGRARRSEFWWFALIYNVGAIVPLLGLLWLLAAILPMLAATSRRLHDTGRSGWWQLISIPGLLGMIIAATSNAKEGTWLVVFFVLYLPAAVLLIVFLAQDTQRSNNAWGPPAK